MTQQSTQPAAPAAPAATAPPAAPARPATAAAPPAGQQPAEPLPRDVGGIILDVIGVAAAVALVVIIADVWTGGKLSGWWRDRRGTRAAGPVPEQ